MLADASITSMARLYSRRNSSKVRSSAWPVSCEPDVVRLPGPTVSPLRIRWRSWASIGCRSDHDATKAWSRQNFQLSHFRLIARSTIGTAVAMTFSSGFSDRATPSMVTTVLISSVDDGGT